MDHDKLILSWSSGKDSALALYEAQNSGFKIDYIFTTVCEDFNRVSIHGIKNELLEKQAKALDLDLKKVSILSTDSMNVYNKKINQFWKNCYLKDNVSEVIFGDIFLEDLKKYREEQLENFQIKARFPLWQRNTSELIKTFIKQGFKAIIICVDTNVMPQEFVGKEIDENFLRELPSNVDPCGENGEFHSFIYDGPIFKKPIEFTKNGVHVKNKFHFCSID